MQTWHLTFSSDGRLALFPLEETRRAAVRVIHHHAGHWLVLFCIVDEHVHVVVHCTLAQLGMIARALVLGLRAHASAFLRPAFIKLVDRRAYAQWLLDYSLGQVDKHDLPEHPALWSGSCFRDLVGARRVGETDLRIRAMLPRFHPELAFHAVGLDAVGPVPFDDDRLGRAGASALIAGAADALCADPQLRGRGELEVRTRRVAVHLGQRAGLRPPLMARHLDITPRAAQYLLRQDVDPRDLAAARLTMAIDEAMSGDALRAYWTRRATRRRNKLRRT